MFEVVDHTLPVKEVHCRSEEVPIERSSESQIFCPARHIGNGDDFFKRHNLDPGNDSYNVQMT